MAVTADAVPEKLTAFAPAGTVTEAGATRLRLPVLTATASPPAPAAGATVTVQLVVAPAAITEGEQDNPKLVGRVEREVVRRSTPDALVVYAAPVPVLEIVTFPWGSTVTRRAAFGGRPTIVCGSAAAGWNAYAMGNGGLAPGTNPTTPLADNCATSTFVPVSAAMVSAAPEEDAGSRTVNQLSF